jgi:uncharacterized SAM-binding protein YcdF (DUF218 family)
MRAFVTELILPPADLLLLAMVGILVYARSPRVGRGALFTALVGLWIFSLPITANSLVRLVQVPNGELGKAEAIVILGAGVWSTAPDYPGRMIDALTLERVRYGAHLASQTHLPVLVSGGQLTADAPSVAELMAMLMHQDLGCDVRWIESHSHTTADNALESAKLLAPAGIVRVYLVTHAWHMRRARFAFKRVGLSVIPAGIGFEQKDAMTLMLFVPSAKALLQSRNALHELLGLVWYAISLPN